jgi:hypothetical protein
MTPLVKRSSSSRGEVGAEGSFSGADEGWGEEQVEFVDQACGEGGGGELCAADGEVVKGGLLEGVWRVRE